MTECSAPTTSPRSWLSNHGDAGEALLRRALCVFRIFSYYKLVETASFQKARFPVSEGAYALGTGCFWVLLTEAKFRKERRNALCVAASLAN